MTQAILPGATIGVLGSGQLGRMFAIAARRMGYRVHTFSPDDDTPTGQVADREVRGAYDDLDAVRAFAGNVDLVTFEFENIPALTAQAAAQRAPVRPSGEVLYITQHRLREKTYLAEHGFPVVPFVPVRSTNELHAALDRLGAPAVLKTAGWGYDGKGQFKLTSQNDVERAWQVLGGGEAVLEAFIDFECEVSVVGARGLDGSTADFGAVWNTHVNHILDVTVAPSGIEPRIAAQACEIAQAVLRQLSVVGVLCVEFFLTRDGHLLINELAPRPHNSGHFTFDACLTSQFEQQLRAICGLTLGSTELLRPAAMANLLGDLWTDGTPDWQAACRFPQVKLHLYGKETARPGRKMGHLTALADTSDEARRLVLAAQECAQPARRAMILDTLDASNRYQRLHRGLAAAFEFLQRSDLAELPPGRYEIDGRQVFALVERATGRGTAGARLEVHRQHIDIQVSLDGREQIGWRPLADCQLIESPFHDERDIGFFSDPPAAWMPLAKGQFMIFFPADAHAPLAGDGPLHKVVIKLLVE